MASPTAKIERILAADCGNVTTTVLLIDFVQGHYRLVATAQAPSTYGSPWQDITVGIRSATRHIEKKTGLVLLAPAGWPITPKSSSQQGTDAFVVVASIGPPLPIALAGLTKEISLASARRAAATTYTFITNELSLDHEVGPNQHTVETRLQALREGQPEMILFVGGADGSVERPVIEIANIISMALQVLPNTDKPYVLFGGNNEARPHVSRILGPVTILKFIDNIRPALEAENLTAAQAELERLYIQRKMSRLPGFDKLRNWSRFSIIPTSRSFEKVIAYLGRHHNISVIATNIGSGATLISTQAGGQQTTTIRTDAGVGHSLASLLQKTPLEKFQRWLPFELDRLELHNHLLNKCLYPASLPTSQEDLMIEGAVAREALRFVARYARSSWTRHPSTGLAGAQWNLLIGAGKPLTGTPHFGYACIMLLDGLEPWGVTKLALDASGLTGVLGLIAAIEPVAAVELVANDTAFLNLGTAIAPTGHGQLDKTALSLTMVGDDETTREIEVPYGSIRIVDLPPGKKATVEIRPTRYFDLGLGQPGRSAVTDVEGGLVGLIIDARGRPLRLAQNDAVRQERLRQWLTSFGISFESKLYAPSRNQH